MAAEETTLASTFQTKSAQGPLLLADISGYTAFLQAVTEAHRDDAFADGAVPEAYRLMSSLLDGIVACIVPPFTLSKLEGDAVFVFADAGSDVPSGEALLDTIRACYADFHSRLADVGEPRMEVRIASTDSIQQGLPARHVRAGIGEDEDGIPLELRERERRNDARDDPVEQAGHQPIGLRHGTVRERVVAVGLRHRLQKGGVAADIGEEQRPLSALGLKRRRQRCFLRSHSPNGSDHSRSGHTSPQPLGLARRMDLE